MLVCDVPAYMLDWDGDKNRQASLCPQTLTTGSRQRVYWKCHVCGGRWQVSVKERRGCPYCSGYKALLGFNDLATVRPDLLSEWDFEKNTAVTPQTVTKGSQKSVFWRCAQGHSWRAQINSRVAGRGCPYCSNRKVWKGFNDLASVRPELVADWDTERNAPLTPENALASSKKAVWWRCHVCGFRWKAALSHRYRGNGCPACAHVRVYPGRNDLLTLYPEIAQEWAAGKNPLSPDQVAPFSRRRVFWVCPRGHEYAAVVSDRVKGTGCPLCAKERRVSFPEKAILFYILQKLPHARANYRSPWLGPYEIDIYLPEYQLGLEYDGVYGHSSSAGTARDQRKNQVCAANGVTLVRIREHGCPPTGPAAVDRFLAPGATVSDAVLLAFQSIADVTGQAFDPDPDGVDPDRDAGAIYSLIEYTEKENCLAVKAPQAAKLWHPTKNGMLLPDKVSVMSSKRVWWQGTCGHEWVSSVAYEASSGLCPYCSGKRILVGFNDLASVRPALALEWDIEKNAPLAPTQITAGSGKKVWWRCARGHSWQASVVSRSRGNGCPICANRIVLAGFNDVASFPSLLADWDTGKNLLPPQAVCIGSEKKAWWVCHLCGYHWQAGVTDRYHGTGCPDCARQARLRHVEKTYVSRSGSLLQNRPDLAAEWVRQRNPTGPDSVACGSRRKVWWVCRTCGFRWNASVTSRTRKNGSGCPQCSKARSVQSRQDTLLQKRAPLTVSHPAVAAQWCPEKNGALSVERVTSGSGKKVWWRCPFCGHEWQEPVYDRCRRGSHCPQCGALPASQDPQP